MGFKLLTYSDVALDFELTVLAMPNTTLLGRGHAPHFRMVFAVFVRCPLVAGRPSNPLPYFPLLRRARFYPEAEF